MPSVTTVACACAAMLAAGGAAAQTTLKLQPSAGHPNQLFTISASGFSPGETVDIYADTTDVEAVAASRRGTLKVSSGIPATAQPGTHYITAIGRSSGGAAQHSLTVTTPWLQAGFDATGQNANPYENTLGAANINRLGIAWSAAGAGSGFPPAVSRGIVYATGQTGLRAIEAATGRVKWTALPTVALSRSPAVGTAAIYVTDGCNNAYALGLNGAQKWSVTLPSCGNVAPLVSGSTVYVGTSSSVLALNAATGATLWTGALTGGTGATGLAAANGVVYATDGVGYLTAFAAATGTSLWSVFDIDQSPYYSVTVAGGVVYAVDNIGRVDAVTAATSSGGGGTILWRQYTPGGGVPGPAAVADGKLFADAGNGTTTSVFALDATTGNTLWTTTVQVSGLALAPTVANGVVYVPVNQSLVALDETTGTILFQAQTGQLYAGPAISDGALYADAANGGIQAFTLNGGAGIARPPTRRPALTQLHPDPRLPIQR